MNHGRAASDGLGHDHGHRDDQVVHDEEHAQALATHQPVELAAEHVQVGDVAFQLLEVLHSAQVIFWLFELERRRRARLGLVRSVEGPRVWRRAGRSGSHKAHLLLALQLLAGHQHQVGAVAVHHHHPQLLALLQTIHQQPLASYCANVCPQANERIVDRHVRAHADYPARKLHHREHDVHVEMLNVRFGGEDPQVGQDTVASALDIIRGQLPLVEVVDERDVDQVLEVGEHQERHHGLVLESATNEEYPLAEQVPQEMTVEYGREKDQ